MLPTSTHPLKTTKLIIQLSLAILFSISSLCVNGQSIPFNEVDLGLFGISENCEIDTIVEMTGTDPTWRHAYIFDSFGGTLEAVITEFYNGSDWVNNYSRFYSIGGGFVPGGYSKQQVDKIWDNQVWVNYLKEVNYYNASDRHTDQITYGWDSDSAEWWNQTWYEFGTDPQSGLLASELKKVGVYQGGIYQYDWEDSEQRLYSYNPIDSLINETTQLKVDSSGFGIWVDIEDQTIYRNVLGFPSSVVSRVHNEDTTGLENDYKIETYYNANNQVTAYIHQVWDNGNWINSSREAWVYNGIDSVAEYSSESDYGNGWEVEYRAAYSYNYADYKDTVVHYFDYGNGLEAEFRQAYYYTQDWQLSVVFDEVPDVNPGDWSFAARYAFDYDSYGNLLEYTEQYWDDEWILETQNFYFYTCSQVTGTKDVGENEKQLLLYPNPTQNTLNLTVGGTPYTGTISVFSTDGRLQLQEQTSSAIDISQLKDGYYMVRFEVDGQPAHAQFVKQ